MQAPDTVFPADYQDLSGLAWNRDPTRAIPGQEALALYEANWRRVDTDALTPAERADRGAGPPLRGRPLAANEIGRVAPPRAPSGRQGLAGRGPRPAAAQPVLVRRRDRDRAGPGRVRVSKDIDFRCADAGGYRALRSLAVSGGVAALFRPSVAEPRPFRADQYGLRCLIAADGLALRFEIVREARIPLDGRPDPVLGVPRRTGWRKSCSPTPTAARTARRRSAIGMLALRRGPLPPAAAAKARAAYGEDVARKLAWALERLNEPEERKAAAGDLGMDPAATDQAVEALARAAASWPPA